MPPPSTGRSPVLRHKLRPRRILLRQGGTPLNERSITPPEPHRLELIGRETLVVSGVEDVDRFDESGIVMSTASGTLIVTGENLHIGKLSLDGGELHVDGRIDSLSYEDEPRTGGGFWSRLLG